MTHPICLFTQSDHVGRLLAHGNLKPSLKKKTEIKKKHSEMEVRDQCEETLYKIQVH